MDGQGGRELTCAFWMLADSEDQGDSGGEGGDPPGAAEVDLHGQGDVRLPFPTYRAPELTLFSRLSLIRPDDKTAVEMKVEAGAILHLVLTLRGGR